MDFILVIMTLQIVEKQRTKLKETIPTEKLEKSRKFRLIEKEVVKRTTKYRESRMKATKVNLRQDNS